MSATTPLSARMFRRNAERLQLQTALAAWAVDVHRLNLAVRRAMKLTGGNLGDRPVVCGLLQGTHRRLHDQHVELCRKYAALGRGGMAERAQLSVASRSLRRQHGLAWRIVELADKEEAADVR
jgi:hypothetical protein